MKEQTINKMIHRRKTKKKQFFRIAYFRHLLIYMNLSNKCGNEINNNKFHWHFGYINKEISSKE